MRGRRVGLWRCEKVEEKAVAGQAPLGRKENRNSTCSRRRRTHSEHVLALYLHKSVFTYMSAWPLHTCVHGDSVAVTREEVERRRETVLFAREG